MRPMVTTNDTPSGSESDAPVDSPPRREEKTIELRGAAAYSMAVRNRSPVDPPYYGFACGSESGNGLRTIAEGLLSPKHGPTGSTFSGYWLRYADGSEWVVGQGCHEDQSGLAARLARGVGASLALVRVRLDVARWARAKGEPDEDELPEGVFEASYFTVRADGTTLRRDPPQDEEPPVSHGDEHETLEAELWARFEREGELERVPLRGVLVPEPGTEGLPARIVELGDLIRSARAFEVTTVAGRSAVRIAAASGARLAVVSEEEIERLVALTGIAPSRKLQ